MTAPPRLSVLMSVYNAQPYLGEAVESILRQTFTDFEFIIVDDGSADGSWELLQAYSRQDVRLVLLRNPSNQGVVRALNRGLEQARAVIIARQDADDISHPDRLLRQLEFLDAHPDYGLVAAVPRLIDPAGVPLDQVHYTATNNEEIQALLLDYMCLCGPTIMFRRECLQAAGFYFSEGLDASEDYDICLRLAEVTRLASLEGDLYLYRQQPASASSVRPAQQMFNKAVALERALMRRSGGRPPMAHLAMLARDYLHAAVIAFTRAHPDLARKSLDEALRVYPPILNQAQPLEDLVRAYTPNASIQTALDYTATIFRDLFPQTKFLRRMRARLISDLHMSQVFAAARAGDYTVVSRHLFPGVRHHPAWLLNPGVLSIALKSLLARVAPRG